MGQSYSHYQNYAYEFEVLLVITWFGILFLIFTFKEEDHDSLPTLPASWPAQPSAQSLQLSEAINNPAPETLPEEPMIPAEPEVPIITLPISPVNPGNHPRGTICPDKFYAILSSPPLDQETLEKHTWNPEDRSLNIFVKDDDRLTFQRHPVSGSTDCIRGKIGYTNGFHVWKIKWPVRQRGTNAVIGVATKDAPLHVDEYTSLIGENSESYGWDLKRNECGHDAKNTQRWKFPNTVTSNDRPYVAPNIIYCILDMEEGYMAFATDDDYHGVAFRGLKGKELYPIVSSVYGHCEITLKYLGNFAPQPRRLMDACRKTIHSSMGIEEDGYEKIENLPLPPPMKNFLMYLDGS